MRAKARLCAQAFNEPLARAGVIKVDSPTVQRIGINIFLQLVVNFRWQRWWRKGDIKSAFLQGKERDVDALGKLYLRPPRGRPLPGVPQGALLEVVRSVYGLPDAPLAWWEELSGFLKEIGFVSSRVDPAFMIHYLPNGSTGAIAIIHVDDLVIANDGSKETEELVEKAPQEISLW